MVARIFLATLLCSAANHAKAATCELTREFTTTAGGENVRLPIGSQVEAMPGDRKNAMVRYALSNGSSTLLFVPLAYLKTAASVTKTPASAIPTATTGTPPSATLVRKDDPIHLKTNNGNSAEGKILRVEKRYAVVIDADSKPHDLLLKDLDPSSTAIVERWKFQNTGKNTPTDPRVKAGSRFSIEFSDLGASRSSDPAKFQIRIPESYQPGKPSPIALFFGGGDGTDDCGILESMVDPKEWIIVAFPYPKDVKTPLYAVQEGRARDLVEFERPMLERLEAIVPNTDPNRRVVIGTSNGAHMIAIGSCDGWKEFPKYFSAYVMHEGGSCESGDFSALRKKHVLIGMGADSEHKGFSEAVANTAKSARVKPDTFVAKGEGHGMGDESRKAIKEWIAKLPQS